MSSQSLSPRRLESFSDGVIAVVITIMVLELKVPPQNSAVGLRHVLPTLLVYLLTFVQVGLYWVNHDYLIDGVETVNHGILWANLGFLFCLSLFPFAMAWVGTTKLSHFSAALYAGVSILSAASYTVLWLQVKSQSVIPPHTGWGKQIASIILYLAAVPVAYYQPVASFSLIAIVAVLWLLPPKTRAKTEPGA